MWAWPHQPPVWGKLKVTNLKNYWTDQLENCFIVFYCEKGTYLSRILISEFTHSISDSSNSYDHIWAFLPIFFPARNFKTAKPNRTILDSKDADDYSPQVPRPSTHETESLWSTARFRFDSLVIIHSLANNFCKKAKFKNPPHGDLGPSGLFPKTIHLSNLVR